MKKIVVFTIFQLFKLCHFGDFLQIDQHFATLLDTYDWCCNIGVANVGNVGVANVAIGVAIMIKEGIVSM